MVSVLQVQATAKENMDRERGVEADRPPFFFLVIALHHGRDDQKRASRWFTRYRARASFAAPLSGYIRPLFFLPF